MPSSKSEHRQTRRKPKLGSITNPPRIIILDNDETVGSFWPLYKALHLIRDFDIKNIRIQDIIPQITQYCLKGNIFRPGVEKLVKTLAALKDANKVDRLVMYTYQREALGRKDDWHVFHNSYGQQINVPFVIDYCFGYIASNFKIVRPFFDSIITRNIHNAFYGRTVDEPFNEKSLDVVFKKTRIYPTHDLRGITFIDDCFMNTHFPEVINKKHIIKGPLSSIYISRYTITIEHMPVLIRESEKLYKTLFSNYTTRDIFDNFIESVKSYVLGDYKYMELCTPPDTPHTYNELSLVKLATRIRSYYTHFKV